MKKRATSSASVETTTEIELTEAQTVTGGLKPLPSGGGYPRGSRRPSTARS